MHKLAVYNEWPHVAIDILIPLSTSAFFPVEPLALAAAAMFPPTALVRW